MDLPEGTKHKIRRLLDDLLKLEKPRRSRTFAQLKAHVQRLIKSLNDFEELAKTRDQTTSIRLRSLFSMSIFLWTFEGPYASTLDVICFLLTIGEPRLNDPYLHKDALSIKDKRKVNMNGKFDFLAKHKCDVFLRKEDRKLRNKIAHRNFVFDEKGNVLVDGQVVDLDFMFSNLCNSIRAFDDALVECIKFTLLKARAQGLLIALNKTTTSDKTFSANRET